MLHNPYNWTALLNKYEYHVFMQLTATAVYWHTDSVTAPSASIQTTLPQSGTWIRYNGFKPSQQNKPSVVTTESVYLATTDFDQHTVHLVSVWHVGQHWVCLFELVMNRKRFIILKAHFITKRINHNSLLSAAYNWLFPWIINKRI